MVPDAPFFYSVSRQRVSEDLAGGSLGVGAYICGHVHMCMYILIFLMCLVYDRNICYSHTSF